MEHQQFAPGGGIGQHRAETRQVILDRRVLFEPRRLFADAGRIIALGFAAHGIPVEVLTVEVNPQEVLPVAERLVSGKRETPAGAAVSFGQGTLFAELARDRNHLLDSVEDHPMLGQQIDAGDLHEFIEGHRRADGMNLLRQGIFAQHMAGQRKMMPFAPVADGPGERSYEQFSGEAVIAVTRSGKIFPEIEEEFRQPVEQIFAVLRLIAFRKFPGPRLDLMTEHMQIIGFVGEDGRHRFPELAADFAGIGFVGYGDELPDRLGIHGIEISGVVEPAGWRIGQHEYAKTVARLFRCGRELPIG
ncbi:hypothetical protein SDC9_86946 [bioreactor metagenome]|uniref:Uncharacterized protein n=1 Tax=bioreactor metagenome TaxID=1076179 RepID=A0A644ZHH4_9ZZZZ